MLRHGGDACLHLDNLLLECSILVADLKRASTAGQPPATLPVEAAHQSSSYSWVLERGGRSASAFHEVKVDERCLWIRSENNPWPQQPQHSDSAPLETHHDQKRLSANPKLMPFFYFI